MINVLTITVNHNDNSVELDVNEKVLIRYINVPNPSQVQELLDTVLGQVFQSTNVILESVNEEVRRTVGDW